MVDDPYRAPIQTGPLIEEGAIPPPKPKPHLRLTLLALACNGIVFVLFNQLGSLPERVLDLAHVLAVSTLLLWWQWHDSERRGIRLGSCIPVIVLLAQPVGMLIYAIKAGRWGWWRLFGSYILVYLVYVAWFAGISYVVWRIHIHP
jgi:hypothetical protein